MLPVPEAFGRYQVAGPLGGRGTSFRAWDTKAFRLVAVTVPEPGTPAQYRRFVDAARAAASFGHPHVVAIIDVDDTGSTPFVVTEFVQGRSFADLVRTRARMVVPQILQQVADLCDAVACVRGHGVPHRSFEADLAMVDRDGGVKLLGVGFADRPDSGPRLDNGEDGVGDAGLTAVIGGAAYDLLAVPAPQATMASTDGRRVPLAVVRPELDGEVAALVDRACGMETGLTLAALAEGLRAHAARLAAPLPAPDVEPVAPQAPERVRTVEPPRAGDRASLARRRAEQIAAHLAHARDALEANDIDGSILACEDALILDPENDRALALLDRIRETTTPDPPEPPASPVRPETPPASEAAVIELVARATGLLARVDYEGALVCLDDARAIDPGHPAVTALRARVLDSLPWSASASPATLLTGMLPAPRTVAPAPAGRLLGDAVSPESVARRDGGRPWPQALSSATAPPPPPEPPSVGRIDAGRIVFGVAAVALLVFAGWAALQPTANGPWSEAGVRSGDATGAARRAAGLQVTSTTLTAPRPAPSDATLTPAATDALEADVASRDVLPSASPASDEASLRATLVAYADAYSALDVDGVMRLFPTASEAGLRRAFSAVRAQHVTIRAEQVEIDGNSATVACVLASSWVGDDGAGTPQRDERRVVFTLTRRSGGWVIADRR